MVTSLDAQCSNQLGGELKHRLFGIPCIQLETRRIADEALLMLTHDAKKQYLLSHFQFLSIEELSASNAELWCATDLVLQNLKDTSFSAACTYLPTDTGYNLPMCSTGTISCPAHSSTVSTFISFNIWLEWKMLPAVAY